MNSTTPEAGLDKELQLKKFQKELNAGTVALLLLTLLSRADSPRYGYEIAKELEQYDSQDLIGKQSALYPVLRNLSGGGLLESWVEPSVSGPPRRYYRITSAGRDMLSSWKVAWQDTSNLVQTLLMESGNEHE
ncbi:MAG: PadR family transcriptional regulator [Gammaproteobacteria bacterium]|nr:PadR family transcriptional regulator [Gammaproteobacteria bacterium]